MNLFNQPGGLECGEHVAALRIGGVDSQAAIADDFAAISNAEIVNFMPASQTPQDAVHHSRQARAGSVETDRDQFQRQLERVFVHQQIRRLAVLLRHERHIENGGVPW